jgi:ubiquinone/menaquinone biosynthesis C-methylase UbiE
MKEYEKSLYLRAKDSQGIGMLNSKDFRGFKNIYIDILQKAALEEISCFEDNSVVLDFGCGTGRFSAWISKKVSLVIGLDVNFNILTLAKKFSNFSNTHYILYNGYSLPLKEEIFHIILCVGILNKRILNQISMEDIISQLKRVLKPKGKVLVIEKVYRKVHKEYYKREEMINFFERQGFSCRQNYPIRKGHTFILYLVKYGLIPQKFIPNIAHYELKIRKRQKEAIFDYKNFLFEFEKDG